MFKMALEKIKKEKEELSKAAKSNNLANKKIAEAQVSVMCHWRIHVY